MISVHVMHELSGRHIDEIKAFLSVVEAGSFARAGREMSRDPTVLSRRVGSLEKRLGVRLIERTTRALMLTEVGARFADQARVALAALVDAEQDAREAAFSVTGTLRLALPASFGRAWVAPRLPEFLALHPNVRLEASFSDRSVNLISENFDLALRIGALPDSSLIARRIAFSRRLLCAAPAYLASRAPILVPADLSQHDCLQFSGLSTYPEWRLHRHVGEKAETAHLRVSGSITTDEPELLVHAALAGLGVVLCSEWLVAPHLASGALRPVLGEWSVGDGEAISLLRPSASLTRQKTKVFCDWLADRLSPVPWAAG